MSAKQLNCDQCFKHMGDVRDASLRKGMTVYCAECDKSIKNRLQMLKNLEMLEKSLYSQSKKSFYD